MNKFLSGYFGYSRDGYYKSKNRKEKENLVTAVLTESVQEIRRKHPRMGGKKLYYLLREPAKRRQ
jgi:hypothetical protein